MRTILLYDGSFDGFLSCVFAVFESKLKNATIVKKANAAETFFDKTIQVVTEKEKAERVWKGIIKYASAEGKQTVYRAFLSELPDIENDILYFIQRIFDTKISVKNKKLIDKDYSDKRILKLAKVVKMVRREKHRMDAFVRFRLTKDGTYFATIEPDFNVLPLNSIHFKNRYADQKWLIYDLKRNYGIYYDLTQVSIVEMALENGINNHHKESLYFTDAESQFQELWKNYFTSTNIKLRKNMRLHLRHVPKRYWKYLSEKNPLISSK